MEKNSENLTLRGQSNHETIGKTSKGVDESLQESMVLNSNLQKVNLSVKSLKSDVIPYNVGKLETSESKNKKSESVNFQKSHQPSIITNEYDPSKTQEKSLNETHDDPFPTNISPKSASSKKQSKNSSNDQSKKSSKKASRMEKLQQIKQKNESTYTFSEAKKSPNTTVQASPLTEKNPQAVQSLMPKMNLMEPNTSRTQQGSHLTSSSNILGLDTTQMQNFDSLGDSHSKANSQPASTKNGKAMNLMVNSDGLDAQISAPPGGAGFPIPKLDLVNSQHIAQTPFSSEFSFEDFLSNKAENLRTNNSKNSELLLKNRDEILNMLKDYKVSSKLRTRSMISPGLSSVIEFSLTNFSEVNFPYNFFLDWAIFQIHTDVLFDKYVGFVQFRFLRQSEGFLQEL